MSEPNVADSQTSKPQRVLACVLCQQRKVKCDREFPCSNCIRSKAQCVPATQLPRRRRRRFAERELLDQLRKYEELLRQNNIKFEPLQKESSVKASPDANQGDDAENDHSGMAEDTSPSVSVKLERISEIKSFWHAVQSRFGSDDDSDSEGERRGIDMNNVSKLMDQTFMNDGAIILGMSDIPVDLSPLHPEPAQILRLWQLFLDNVNPLLRVVHAPTVQGYIIEAISNIKAIKPVVEALIFSIYCMAIFSLSDDECPLIFGASRAELQTKYQFGCQQALANAKFLRSSDRECLSAFFLYTVSFTHNTDPRAVSSVMGMAIRIAQRMKIDRESECAEHGVFEAEMRRRLWWALVLYDLRLCQIAGDKSQVLTPVFSTAIPLNVSDVEIRPEMKEAPQTHEEPTESIYTVVKVEIANFWRYSLFNIAYNHAELAPFLNTQNKLLRDDSELVELDRMIEQKYLRFCNPEVPLHFVTMWEARTLIAKCRLLEDYSLHVNPSITEAEKLEPAVIHALRVLECDTKLMSSPLVKGFRWMMYFNFPLPGYIHLIKFLKRIPLSHLAEKAWQVMNDNFEAWEFMSWSRNDSFSTTVYKMILGAWSHRETALIQAGDIIIPPPIIAKLRELVNRKTQSLGSQANTFDSTNGGTAGSSEAGPVDLSGWSMNLQGFDSFGMFGYETSDYNIASLDSNVSSLDWAASTMDWGVGQRTNW